MISITIVFIDRYAETLEHELLHIENDLVTAPAAGRAASETIRKAGLGGVVANLAGAVQRNSCSWLEKQWINISGPACIQGWPPSNER